VLADGLALGLLALAGCVYRAVASEKPMGKKLFSYNKGLLSPGVEIYWKIYRQDVEARLMKPAARTAARPVWRLGCYWH